MDRMKIALALVLGAFLLRLGYDQAFGGGTDGVPLRLSLSQFPADAAGPDWIGRDEPLEPKVVRLAGVSEYLNRTYRRDGYNLWFYVGYYNGSTVEAIHQPEVCFPAQGYKTVSREVLSFPSDWTDMKFNLITFQKMDRRRLTAYTFYYRGRFETDDEAIFRGRAFSSRYYAVLIATVDFVGGSGGTRPRELLGELIRGTVPRLKEHFPLEDQGNRTK